MKKWKVYWALVSYAGLLVLFYNINPHRFGSSNNNSLPNAIIWVIFSLIAGLILYRVRNATWAIGRLTVSVPSGTYTALAMKEPLPVQRPVRGLIFPGKEGKPHSRGWLNKALKRGAIAIGVPTLGIHRLRGTFATLHLRKNTPLKEVQEMMGHWTSLTTLGYQETSTKEQKKHQDELWGD